MPVSPADGGGPLLAIMIAAMFVLSETIVDMTDASTARRPSMPSTVTSGATAWSEPMPMAQLPTGWKLDPAASARRARCGQR
ncbi:hypothetical protein ACM01_07900 [Streptomyces viridochromogenes]|uniref:Uncharacterized protein n=1 Tax=Streptomyces viridochromogenes TaxID=1938 RepID=A0A0J7ZII7_STRVR|nr:hypothetical protein ACM01_07900 [Streptomyces viridochromogenes]KOG07031.1 hypothetical protein ADK35_44580 [Streptomyces viridochromogenes]KOG16895.1 hypothetical protein ADK36_25435 [Streptomyces viridochromogenes]